MTMNNYEHYFGTPEKAAETISDIVDCCGAGKGNYGCRLCILKSECEYELTIYHWLKKEWVGD